MNYTVRMGLFNRQKREHTLPNNLFDRVGEAAACIYSAFNNSGIINNKGKDIDIFIWEYTGYILATLYVAERINSSMSNRIRWKMSELYPEDDKRNKDSRVWILLSKSFYEKEIYSMMNGDHKLPDVIVYNLTHPVESGRKDFDALPLFEIDFFKMHSAWTTISTIIGEYFFRNDEDITKLPMGV